MTSKELKIIKEHREVTVIVGPRGGRRAGLARSG